MEKARVGVIGMGRMGLTHFSIINTHLAVELTAVADTSTVMLSMMKKMLPDVKQFTDFNDLLESGLVDAVIVCTPSSLHYPVCKLACENGISVFCEKPFTTDPKIIYVFDKFDLAEQRGLGFKTVRALPETYGIPLPKVGFEEPYLIISMPFAYSEKKRNDVDASLEKGVDFAKTHPVFSKSDYDNGLNLSARTAERQLHQLTHMDILVEVGSGPNTKYKYKNHS